MLAIAGREQGRALLHVTRLRGKTTRVLRAPASATSFARTSRSTRPPIHSSIRVSIYRAKHLSRECSQLCDLTRSTTRARLVRGILENSPRRSRQSRRNFAAASASQRPYQPLERLTPNRADPLTRRTLRGVRLVRRPRSVGIGGRRRMKRRTNRENGPTKRFVLTSIRVETRDRW